MRKVSAVQLSNSKPALTIFTLGCVAISVLCVCQIFIPEVVAPDLVATLVVIISVGLALLGLSGYRGQYQNLALQALADHLGNEIIYLEALNSTITDHTCAFDQERIVTLSPAFLVVFDLNKLNSPEELAERLQPNQRDLFMSSLEGLRDAGEQFVRTFITVGGHSVEISGHRAQFKRAQSSIYVLRARDVTVEADARAKEQALRDELSRQLQAWQNRLGSIPLPLWIRREDLSLAWINKTAADMLECEAHVAIDQQKELFVGALGEDGRWLAEQSQLDGQIRHELAASVIKGERKLFHVTEIPLHQPGAAFLGYAIDFTKLDDKEKELKRHIAGNAAVLERLSTAIAIYGPDQHLKFYNQAFVDLWGLPESFLRMMPNYSEILEELRANRMLAEQADFAGWRREQLALFTSLIEPQEDLQHLPDGRMLRTLTAPHPFGGLMFVYEDVSRRYELETSYNTLQAVQTETMNNLAEGICVYGSDGRLKLYNPAFQRLWKLEPSWLSNEPHAADIQNRLRPFFNIMEVDWPNFLKDMVSLVLDRTPRTGRLERADGTVLDYSAQPLPDGAIMHSFLDITDSVKVEEALRESNDALEAADRLKSEFIANITYQLRTPLTAIMGFTEILQHEYFGALNERQKDYCNNIMDAGKRLVTLINDILELATIEAGYMSLERVDVDVPAMVHSVAGVVADWARQEEIELEVSCPAEVGLVALDERRIRQALFNLLSNAIKFTPTGGRVIISAERDEDNLTLIVSDNGIGISIEDQSRILKRFERANVRTGQAGVGLGLSVVKSIVELHQGRVEIKSAPNRGFTVRCIIPLVPHEDFRLLEGEVTPHPVL